MTKDQVSGNPALWLEMIALLGAVTLIVWLAFAQPSETTQRPDKQKAWLLGHASLLESQISDFRTKAIHYLENAPREYDAYFRDTTITFPHLQTDLNSLDQGIHALIDAGFDPDEDRIPNHETDSDQVHIPHMAELRQEWRKFKTGLEEQLGVDPEMPRLEWGTRHISEELAPVISSLEEIRERLQATTALSSTLTDESQVRAWIIFCAWLVLALIWFGLRVRRIRH